MFRRPGSTRLCLLQSGVYNDLAFLGRTPEDLADLPWTTCHQGTSARSRSIVADRADAPNACRRFDVGLVIVWCSR